MFPFLFKNMLHLPDIITIFVKFLSPLEILNAIQVCKTWNETITHSNLIAMHILLCFAKISTTFEKYSSTWHEIHPFLNHILPIFDPIAYNITSMFPTTSAFQLYSRLFSTDVFVHNNIHHLFSRDIHAIANILDTCTIATFKSSFYSFVNLYIFI